MLKFMETLFVKLLSRTPVILYLFNMMQISFFVLGLFVYINVFPGMTQALAFTAWTSLSCSAGQA